MKKVIGILGGTFDPIHFGHLRIALELYQQLALDEVRFIPCQKPVLKNNAQATVGQRLAMLQLAIKDQPGFVIDERELQRATPSYTVDTLISLREELGDVSLCLILGRDSFNELPQWHRWQELIKLTNITVVNRLDPFSGRKGQGEEPAEVDKVLDDFLQQYQAKDPGELRKISAGKIWLADLAPLVISSTVIRQQIAKSLSPRYLLPDNVWHYIQQQHLYRE